MNKLPRRSPGPGRPFVNREQEIQVVQRKLDIGLQGQLMPSVIICYQGAFGIGKSWLLIELERRYKRTDRQVNSILYPTITARLDLNQEVLPTLWQNGHLNREALIRELWKQLATQAGANLPDLVRSNPSPEEWADAFVAEVTAWSAKWVTPIIMLDTVDNLVTQDEKTFFWLEQYIVERLAMTDRVLFIFTSRGELRRWRRFQVRRRVDTRKLVAFDAMTVGQQLKANEKASQMLFEHAFGHPFFTERLGTILEESDVNLQMAQEEDLRPGSSTLRSTLGKIIAEILEPMPDDLVADLARYACVLRWVSVEPLRFLAEALGLTEPHRGDAYYLELIANLQAHHLLYWHSERNSYHSDPTLRRLLAYFLELDEPDKFWSAHLAAFKYHDQHLREFPQYLARYVPELIYHHSMLTHSESLQAQPPTWQAWWEQFLAEKAPNSLEPWHELVDILEQDDELRQALPPKDYNLLLLKAQERAAEAVS